MLDPVIVALFQSVRGAINDSASLYAIYDEWHVIR